MDDILKEFLVETHEGLNRLDRDLVTLEQVPDSREVLAQIFRTIHSIKGTSGFLGLTRLGAIAHVGENLLSLLRDGRRRASPEVTSALLAMADAIRAILGHVETHRREGDAEYAALIDTLSALAADERPSAAPSNQERAAAPPMIRVEAVDAARSEVAETSLRVDVGLLDSLMNLVGELVLARNQLLQAAANHTDAGFLATCQRLDVVTTGLQEGVMKTRMQPIGSVWAKYPRVVRDLGIALHKRVRIEMEGRNTELDRTVIESIKDPLLHAIRNAVDHGIERPDVRQARGKPEDGCIRLRAFHEGGQVNIEIADDGGGIDPERVRAKAVAAGLVTADRAARMSGRELIHLITLPGFSTAEKVTAISGRGVGMDVVKTNIEKIGGTIDIRSTVGTGTTLRIQIPLTLAIVPALLVRSGGERFAIPQVNLIELVRLSPEQARQRIERVHGSPVLRLRGRLLPLLHLDSVLGQRDTDDRSQDHDTSVVVLRADDRQFGLVVDGILDTEEIVVKPLGAHLQDVSAFAGAAILGDGRIALILDVVGLAKAAQLAPEVVHRETIAVAAHRPRSSLLLVELCDGSRAALDLDVVARLEEFPIDAVEHAAGEEVVQYRSAIMPLVRPTAAADSRGARQGGVTVVVVHGPGGRAVGLIVARVIDIVDESCRVTPHRLRRGVRGAVTLQGRVTDLLDVTDLLAARLPDFALTAAEAT